MSVPTFTILSDHHSLPTPGSTSTALQCFRNLAQTASPSNSPTTTAYSTHPALPSKSIGFYPPGEPSYSGIALNYPQSTVPIATLVVCSADAASVLVILLSAALHMLVCICLPALPIDSVWSSKTPSREDMLIVEALGLVLAGLWSASSRTFRHAPMSGRNSRKRVSGTSVLTECAEMTSL